MEKSYYPTLIGGDKQLDGLGGGGAHVLVPLLKRL